MDEGLKKRHVLNGKKMIVKMFGTALAIGQKEQDSA